MRRVVASALDLAVTGLLAANGNLEDCSADGTVARRWAPSITRIHRKVALPSGKTRLSAADG